MLAYTSFSSSVEQPCKIGGSAKRACSLAALTAKKADTAAKGIDKDREIAMLRDLGSAGVSSSAERNLHRTVARLGFGLPLRIRFVFS